MPSDEIHELLVAVRPDGIDDVSEGLDGVQGKFEETADETERTASIIGEMSERLHGAAGIIVGTLVTLAAGIATQVPVIGESVSGLIAILDSIFLKIDEDLRPSFSKFNAELFDIADQIARSEGTFEALAIAVGRLEVAWGALVPLSPLRLALRLRSAINDVEEFGGELVSKAERVFSDFVSAADAELQEFVSTVAGRVGGRLIPPSRSLRRNSVKS